MWTFALVEHKSRRSSRRSLSKIEIAPYGGGGGRHPGGAAQLRGTMCTASRDCPSRGSIEQQPVGSLVGEHSEF